MPRRRRPYDKGADDEREIMKLLVKQGFTAFRSAGSRGPIDVIGIGPQTIILISATRDGQPLKGRRKALQDVPTPPNVVKELWIKYPRHGYEKEIVF